MTLKNDAALHNALVRARSKFGTVVLDKKWEDGMKYASLESIECGRDPLESEGITYHFGDFYGAERMPGWKPSSSRGKSRFAGAVRQDSILMEWDPKTNRVAQMEEQEIFSKRILQWLLRGTHGPFDGKPQKVGNIPRQGRFGGYRVNLLGLCGRMPASGRCAKRPHSGRKPPSSRIAGGRGGKPYARFSIRLC